MTDFERAFEARFSIEDEKRGVDTSYRKWLLKGSNGECPTVPSEEEMKSAKEWHGRCEMLIDEAKRLAEAGVPRDGFEFDDLKRRAMALADDCFRGQDRGIVFGYVAQAYDKAGGSVTGPEWNEDVAKWITYPRMDAEKFRMVREIERFAGWGDDYKSTVDDLCKKFKENYVDAEKLIDIAVSNGALFQCLKEDAYSCGIKGKGEDCVQVMIEKASFPKIFQEKIFDAFRSGVNAKLRAKEAQEIAQKIMNKRDETKTKTEETISLPGKNRTVDLRKYAGRHPNSVLNLKPCNKWTIVADETGELFGNDAFKGRNGSGKYVFVIIPEGADLPPASIGFHANEQHGLTPILEMADVLYESGVGILGVPVTALYRTNRDLWHASIETLLDITLRLLPVEEDTEIILNIEQRGTANSGNKVMADFICDHAMYRLAMTEPEKAKKISLFANYVGKNECPFNGYVDTVAFLWGSGNKDTKFVFEEYGWVGPCLIEGSAKAVDVFHRCLDLVNFHRLLSEADWNALVAGSGTKGSLIGALLRAYGEEARKDLSRWRVYLDYVLAHLDSKAIKMSVLMPQISWLKEYEPAEVELPPRLRLLWLTAQLAYSNHRGGTTFGLQKYADEFDALSARLKDEDAPLVCFAALHRAVEMTDAYRFEEARSLLSPWEAEPAAVPGLRYHAQVLSSLGQHAAFLGDDEKALSYFKRAMVEFSRLSDGWQRDFDHTCAYAVISAMDCAAPEFNGLMAMYLYGEEWQDETMVDMAQQLAAIGDDESDSKYAHAILLRYLVSLPGDNLLRRAYLERRAEWKWSTDGHPWELIAFYRAMLLDDSDPERVEWLRRGYELCLGQGPTLQSIASVIGAARMSAGDMTKEEYLEKVDEVVAILPGIGESRIAALRHQVESPMSVLELAKTVLPFNFR